MRTVDVTELESNLRDLLRAVRAGETLRVVHDGEVVAELARPRAGAPEEARDGAREEVREEVPPSGRGADPEARLQALAAAGQVQLPRDPDSRWRWTPKGLGLDPATVQQLLDDVRADRWP